MNLVRSHFADFFAAVHDGHLPFAWQERLLDHLLEHGRWPDRIAAPTGAGKSAVIDVHVFAVALTTSVGGARLPRRLAVVVDRRFLIDDQYDHAVDIARLLARPVSGVLRAVAQALADLRWHQEADHPLVVARLRGGLPTPRSWMDDPTCCAVLNCTPDMWGSRLLLHGYGASRPARPRAAGLLAIDSAVIVDEAHLTRQLLRTARRVAELQDLVGRPVQGPPSLQVVETTATPDRRAVGTEVAVEEADLTVDAPLRARLTRPKPVALLALSEWPAAKPGAARKNVVNTVVDAVVTMHERHGATVGCVLNTVALAVDVHEALRERGLRTELLCGRLRSADVRRLRKRRPGLLTTAGDPSIDVVVATQTLEVGLDVDLSGLVTELAPGTALAQRAGRVNRLGIREAGEVVVVAPEGPIAEKAVTLPYKRDELEDSLRWLADRTLAGAGLAPWALREARPPAQRLRRLLLQRLELADSWLMARSSDDVAQEPDLDLWLSDDLEPDRDIGIVARHDLPVEHAEALELVRLLPPREHETFPVRIAQARDVVQRALDDAAADAPPLLLARQQEVSVLVDARLHPGDVVIVDDRVRLLRSGVVDPDGRERADDVLEVTDPAVGSVVLRIGQGSTLPADHQSTDTAIQTTGDLVHLVGDLDERGRAFSKESRTVFADRLDGLASLLPDERCQVVTAAAQLLRQRVKNSEVTVLRTGSERRPVGVVILDLRRAAAAEDLRQLWTSSDDPVPLAQHAASVSARAAELGNRLGLAEIDVEVLRLAGEHHDDGKSDPRFQVVLGRGGDQDGSSPLAKSGMSSPRQVQQARAASGLPQGWRHEQLSVLQAWLSLADMNGERRMLVARLVGTSHGHGRGVFSHSAAELSGGIVHPVARELFDVGLWDEIVEETDSQRGVWACAYLEAVLRAADGQVSREGS